MNRGDTVFDIDGREYTWLAEVEDVGHVVAAAYCDSDGCAYDCEPSIIEQVFAAPPSDKFDKVIAERRAELESIQQQIRTSQKEWDELRAGRDKLAVRLAQENIALQRIADFLDEKITHYVKNSYGTVTILTLAEAVCESERMNRHPKLKLLTLFGDSKGNLEWNLNWYKDGSGSNETVHPCCSLEEAKAVAQSHVDDILSRWQNSCQVQSALKAAQQYGLAFPQEAIERLRDEQRQEAVKQVEKCRNELAVSEMALDAIDVINQATEGAA